MNTPPIQSGENGNIAVGLYGGEIWVLEVPVQYVDTLMAIDIKKFWVGEKSLWHLRLIYRCVWLIIRDSVFTEDVLLIGIGNIDEMGYL